MAEAWGAQHPNTLAARDQYARFLGEAGDPEGAAAQYADLTDMLDRVLGPDADLTRQARNGLRHWREASRNG
jgi:hypothetical protein